MDPQTSPTPASGPTSASGPDSAPAAGSVPSPEVGPGVAPGDDRRRAAHRSLAPDLARGLMLLLIALANVSWHLWGRETGITHAHLVEGSALDKVLQALMMVLVDGRSYPLFAFLFGYGMVQFFRSRTDRGLPERTVRRMLRRRHWAMLLFGLVHAALLFMGDVLGAYGLAGLVLVWIFFRRRDRTLLVWAGVMWAVLALVAALALVGGIMTILFPEESASAQFAGPAGMQDLISGAPTYLASILPRLGMWAVITVAQVAGLAIPIAILLGWVAARHRLLDDPGSHRVALRRIAVIGIPIGWAGGLPSALSTLGILEIPQQASWMFSALSSTAGIAAGIGYAAVFALVAARLQESRPPLVRAIAAVGERSLTFYLWQSLVFAIVLSNWGFGVGGWAGTSLALLIAALTWAASIPMAALLASRGARGPAERVLRRLTYGRDDRAAR